MEPCQREPSAGPQPHAWGKITEEGPWVQFGRDSPQISGQRFFRGQVSGFKSQFVKTKVFCRLP